MRLIDADALMAIMYERKKPEHGADKTKERWRYIQWLTDYRTIADAPTVDAVPVTRCADCEISHEHNGKLLCTRESWLGYPRKPEDFCSRAIPGPEQEQLTLF